MNAYQKKNDIYLSANRPAHAWLQMISIRAMMDQPLTATKGRTTYWAIWTGMPCSNDIYHAIWTGPCLLNK